MNVLDVHAHIDMHEFDKDRREIIKKCASLGISVINNGLNPESNRKTLALSKEFDNVLPALGLYPQYATKISEEEVKKEISFIKKNPPIAIGEIGLDYKWENSQKDVQVKVFKKMLGLAQELGVPAIIHSRQAESDVLETLKSFDLKVVLHCFGGNKKQVLEGVRAGHHFSIPPRIMTNSEMQGLVRLVPLKQVLLETDSPFMSERKGLRNDPTHVLHTIKKISEIKKMNEETVIEQIKKNQKIFRQV